MTENETEKEKQTQRGQYTRRYIVGVIHFAKVSYYIPGFDLISLNTSTPELVKTCEP